METIYFEIDCEIKIFESCFIKKLPLLLKGPTGCGKSQLVQYMSEKLKVPLVKVSCNEDTNAADLLGRYLIKGNETVWQDGPVTRAVKNGSMLYLDEIAEAREDVIVALHPLTDHRRELYLDRTNELIKAHENFMCVASFNPGYQKGFRELKPSTKQRFVSVKMDYLDPEQEKDLIIKSTNINPDMAENLVKFASKTRKMTALNLRETVSTRLLIHAASLMSLDLNPRRACYHAIAEVLSDDVETIFALKDLINLCF